MEQVATAALDCRAFPLAKSIILQIRDKFPVSLRAARISVRSSLTPTLLGNVCARCQQSVLSAWGASSATLPSTPLVALGEHQVCLHEDVAIRHNF